VDDIVRRIAALPEVESAAASDYVPFYAGGGGCLVEPDVPSGTGLPITFCVTVTADYFRALGAAIEAGRSLTAAEVAANRPVAVVGRRFAEEVFGSPDAVGRRFRLVPGGVWITVVGVAADIRHWDLWNAPPETTYLPFPQSGFRRVGLLVRTRGEPLAAAAPVQGALQGSDPALAAYSVTTMEALRTDRLAFDQVWSLAFLLLGMVALAMAAVGTYGVLAYQVSRRLREIGIRLALGAQRRDVLRLVMGEGILLTLAGLLLGLAGALALSRSLTPLLYGVSPTDPVSYLGTLVLLFDVAFVACWLPARRALEVDPVDVLRSE
jgi:putative ABC transport system permease protein